MYFYSYYLGSPSWFIRIAFFCCDSWISFQIYKGLSYLISDTAQGEWGKTRFFLFFSPVCDLSEPTVYTYTRSNDNREQRFGMFPIFFFLFPSATFNKPLGWTESLLCVSMQRRLILDRSADTFHPGDFVDSTGNVLNPTGRYYLHRRPRRS